MVGERNPLRDPELAMGPADGIHTSCQRAPFSADLGTKDRSQRAAEQPAQRRWELLTPPAHRKIVVRGQTPLVHPHLVLTLGVATIRKRRVAPHLRNEQSALHPYTVTVDVGGNELVLEVDGREILRQNVSDVSGTFGMGNWFDTTVGYHDMTRTVR